MHLWNDSSEGGSSPQEVRYAQLIRNPEQSRVRNILDVGSPLSASLDMGMLGAWQGGDRHPNIGPAVNLILRRWLDILFERGCRFKRLDEENGCYFWLSGLLGGRRGEWVETVQGRLSRLLTVATVCVCALWTLWSWIDSQLFAHKLQRAAKSMAEVCQKLRS